MTAKEFIIVLTGHRTLGDVFLPYLIHKEDKFHTTIKLVKPADLKTLDYIFQPYEKELVFLIDKYSDERLMKRFSRASNVTEFFANLEPARYRNSVLPYLEQTMWEVVNILMLSPVRLIKKEVKYANIYDEDEIFVPPFFAKPVFHFKRTSTETRYRLMIYHNEKEIPLLNKRLSMVTNNPGMFIYQRQLVVFDKLDGKKLLPFFNKEYVSIPKAIEDKYYSGFIKKTIREFEVVAEGFELRDNDVEKKAVLFVEYNLRSEPCFVLRYIYGEERFVHDSKREVAVHFKKTYESFFFRKINRDKTWERRKMDFLKSLGLVEKDGFLVLQKTISIETGAVYPLINWYSDKRNVLEKAGIFLEQEKLDKKYFTGQQNVELKATTSGDWFDVYAKVTFGAYTFPFIKLKNHILNDIREFELPNGEIAIIPEEWFASYKSLIPFAHGQNDKIQFQKHHYPLLSQVLRQSEESLLNEIQKMSGYRDKVDLPKGLLAELRSYQNAGFQWMYGLNKNGFGGCLADDMGLGKTLQTLSLLLKVKGPETSGLVTIHRPQNEQLNLFDEPQSDNHIQTASLIVLPTSLVHNWEAEIHRFTPALRVYKHIGQQRKTGIALEEAILNFDVILTTYGTVRNDVDTLCRVRFYYIVLDESQYVKNSSSKTYKAVLKLHCEHRLALTGTPIENSLTDLWSQMNFLNKGLLGNLQFFKRFFITPIEKHNDQVQQEKLHLLIRPFILRRTKDEVARDLPPLMEQIILCEMVDAQEKIYETEKSVIRNSILEDVENEGINRSSVVILKGLTRLRQLANHPKMIDVNEEIDSGKFDEIFRMLENVVAENHKVLVFSSFVKHLELIKMRIEKNDWKYSILTGKTANREDVIKQFQETPDNKIFLISLKAGGVGLNLTSADYVFIVDPWWNPASENQAISRAHRIGQNKHVFVYRFITKGTIEEKILKLQNEKSSLADKFINSNNPLQEITKEELMSLFK